MTDEERDRYASYGEFFFENAKKLGWQDDGEGAYEFIVRTAYQAGWDDHVARTAMPQWKPITPSNDFPQDGMPFDVKAPHSFRWLPYKRPEAVKNAAFVETIKGVAGRWQFYNENGNWVNTRRPQGMWLDAKLDYELSGNGS